MSRNSKLREDAEFAVKIYANRILKGLNEDVIDMVEMMMHGLRCIYVLDAKCFPSQTDMNKQVRKINNFIYLILFSVFIVI